MPKRRSIFALLALSACVAGVDGSVQRVDGRALQITRNSDYFWPDSTMVTDPAGRSQQVEVFPIVTALEVRPSGGGDLTRADEPAAYAAVQAHCRARGLVPPGPYARFDSGGWAFPDCRAP